MYKKCHEPPVLGYKLQTIRNLFKSLTKNDKTTKPFRLKA